MSGSYDGAGRKERPGADQHHPPPNRERDWSACFVFIMPQRFEDQPWYSEWKKTMDRVIAALMTRDSTKRGTSEREVADREYEAAMIAFRLLAEQHAKGTAG